MKLNILTPVFAVLLLSGCNSTIPGGAVESFEKGKRLSEMTDKRIKEASGLVASPRNPGMLWTHNDSGNDAEIFLVNEKLDIKLTVTLVGAENRDWEDITIGPGPDSSQTYIYIGDIGDNKAVYPYKYIYRFPEPVFSGENQISITEFDKIVFKLGDKVKDTESLFLDAKSKNLYLLSKREEPVVLYELKHPHMVNDTLTATVVASLPFKEIVSADCFSKTGDILMKNYTSVYYWENKNHENVVSLLKRQPVEVSYEEEPQGESIAWSVDGKGFYTLSEKKKKEQSFLYYYSKR